ncbi:hypothetical protein HJFPF1_00853 [Paramyrothecium foliicola]|nr:hypothetical protein HJFPF1_00853 [Paramyrothecium foliicola]
MADSSMSYLYTIGGYATLFGVGYAIYHVSTQKNKKRLGAVQTKPLRTTQPEPRKEDKKKKQRMESFASELQDAKQAAKASAEAKPVEAAPVASQTRVKDTSDDVDNREFARQLAKAQEGHNLSSKVESGKQREKSVKQSRANQITPAKKEEKISTPSSTTGADADDDQSPAASPEAAPVDVSGVADMLEPARAGPSVLRLTDTTEKKQKPKAAKAAQPVETKKQRQNRQKAEAAKAAREEAEKDRKVLEEKQRRQARVAEGRAAKDGSQFMAAVNGNKSAWQQGNVNGTAAEDKALHQPLDTFEPVPSKKQEQPAKPKASNGNWASSLPSEEEQLELLKDDADEWSTVKTKASKKPAKKSSSGDSGDEPAQSRPAAAVKQPSTGTAASKANAPQNFGSFSALTSKDDPADEEEEEEEWDV